VVLEVLVCVDQNWHSIIFVKRQNIQFSVEEGLNFNAGMLLGLLSEKIEDVFLVLGFRKSQKRLC